MSTENNHNASGQNSNQTREVPESTRDPTNVLLISNLQRPFTNGSLRSLLSEYGKVLDLWINGKKTHSIVTFSNYEEAKTARSNLYNVKWPENGKFLILEYIEESEKPKVMEKCDTVGMSVENENNNNESSALGGDTALKRKESDTPSKRELAELKRNAKGTLRAKRRGDKMNMEDEEGAMTELSKIFRKTICKPQIFYMPNSKEKAEKLLSLRKK